MKKTVKTNLKAIAFLAVFSFLFFSRFFSPKPQLLFTPDFRSSDIFHFNYALKDYLSVSLKANQLPLWSDKIGGGMPVLAEGQIGAFNFFNLVFFRLLPVWLAFNLTIIITFFILSAGQYYYLRSLKLSSLPALLGSISFSYSCYFLTKITQIISFNFILS